MIHPIIYDGKTYSKIYDEKNFDRAEDFYHAMDRIHMRLSKGIFQDQDGKLYRAKFKIYDLSKRTEDTIMNVIFTYHRIFKYKWKYLPI